MIRFEPLLLVCLTLLLPAPAIAQSEANETDTEVALTPRSMAALLPQPQTGEMQYDFYMLGRADSAGEAEWDHCMRYTGRKADGLFVVSFVNDATGRIQTTKRLSYDQNGELQLYRDQLTALKSVFGFDLINDNCGKPYFDHIYVKRKQVTRRAFGNKKKGEVETQYGTHRFPLSDTSKDQSWMPIIMAYHFRQGHQRFRIKQHTIEQEGTEQVDFDGETHTVRVLLVRNRSTGKTHCRLRVFETGEYYSINLLGDKDPRYEGPFGSTQQRVTSAQLEEILDIKLDENGNPPSPW